MSYNYSEFKKKKKDNFNPCAPPDRDWETLINQSIV